MRILYIITGLILIFLNGCNEQHKEIVQSEKTRLEKWTEDLNYFENEYLNNSKTYTKDSMNSCKLLITDLKTKIPTLSDNQIVLELSKCVAMANNGHTTIHLSEMDKIPVRFYWFA
ncbi:MAG: hypothetical protein AAFZ89_09190, partial [Bacteroidota bacterium]